MIKIYYLLIYLLLTFSTEAIAGVLNNCPSFDSHSSLTQNMNGNSSYTDPSLMAFFRSLKNMTKFNLNEPILDVGAGYGSATFELIKLGAKNIYVNDLDKQNLECMQNNINRVYNNKNFKLTYLSGDIVSDQILLQLPNQYFTLIYAQDVIHFFTYDQLIKFIKILNQKAKRDGVVVLVFENQYLDTLNFMIATIFNFHKKYPKYSLNEITKTLYKKIEFPGHRHCSDAVYNNVASDIKLPGFPCELPVGGGEGQLLLPDIIIDLMQASGFDNIYRKSYSNHERTQFLIFVKKNNINEKQTEENIKILFKRRIEAIEG